jgi:hypothetical protein
MSTLSQELQNAIWGDIETENDFPSKAPLLAHYTSISVVERIVANNEIWFSNPLFMNDFEELRFGVNEGMTAYRESDDLTSVSRSLGVKAQLDDFMRQHQQRFNQREAFDTYVLCFSEHAAGDCDGSLSMWRGYGANGSGAAIVFDTSRLKADDGGPLILSHVGYATVNERRDWLRNKMSIISRALAVESLSQEDVWSLSYAIFERIKLFALFTKHVGFEEENEWRAVYVLSRDPAKRLEKFFNYFVGPRGIEPKLKFKIEPIDGITPPDFHLSQIVHRIILGPTVSDELSVASMRRMLKVNGVSELGDRLIASSTPYRQK